MDFNNNFVRLTATSAQRSVRCVRGRIERKLKRDAAIDCERQFCCGMRGDQRRLPVFRDGVRPSLRLV